MDRTSALIPALLLVAALAPAAAAAPPANDAPAAAGAFEVYSAVDGVPTERTATAELAEATPDPGVLPCLGTGSFARTVWYRLPEVGATQWVTISAVGRTLAPIDLAAFIQPQNIPPATPTIRRWLLIAPIDWRACSATGSISNCSATASTRSVVARPG